MKLPPETINIRLSQPHARNIAFLLSESYSKWGAELDHWVRYDDHYPAEIMEHLDAIDIVNDQLQEQGIDWNDLSP